MSIIAFCGFHHDLPTTLVGSGASVSTSVLHDGAPPLEIDFDGSSRNSRRTASLAFEAKSVASGALGFFLPFPWGMDATEVSTGHYCDKHLTCQHLQLLTRVYIS